MIDYTAHKSPYEHEDKPRERPRVYTRVGRVDEVDRLSSIIY